MDGACTISCWLIFQERYHSSPQVKMRSILVNGIVRRVASSSLRKCSIPTAVAVGAIEPIIAGGAISTSANVRSFASVAGGVELASLKQANPHVDVVKYKHKNRIWTLNHVDYYSEAVAIGLVENGLKPGDVVLSWLPSHFSEQMVLQFACSKAGLVLYTIDPALAVTDPIASKQALEAALNLTNANVLISQEAGSDVNYVRLAESVIPELRIFDYSVGEPFVTPRFPHLRFCIHTGFDQDEKYGWLPLRHMVVPSGNLDTYVPPGSITGSTPLAGGFVINDKGIPTKLGKTLSNEEVLKNNAWPTYTKILKKEFHQVEGVGVIF